MDPRARSYRRFAAVLTGQPLLHPAEKEREIAAAPIWKRRSARIELAAAWDLDERRAADEAAAALATLRDAALELQGALLMLTSLPRPRAYGKVEEARRTVEGSLNAVAESGQLIAVRDFGEAGRVALEAERKLFEVQGPLLAALNHELNQTVVPREPKARLLAAAERRRAAQAATEEARQASPRDGFLAAAATHRALAEVLGLAAGILAEQPAPARTQPPNADGAVRAVQAQDLETYDDVGGMDQVKARLSRALKLILESSARGTAAHNGVLLYGPSGSGKTLLARAAAGQHGLRLIRFTPGAAASSYAHESPRKLRDVFALAARSTPCLLFLDDLDLIGGRSAAGDQEAREFAAQLIESIDQHRAVPGLAIAGAVRELDELDPPLREGRFESRIAIPQPDPETRRAIVQIQLRRHGQRVDWEGVNLDEVSQLTSGRSGAALSGLVTAAAERAAAAGTPIRQLHLLAAIDERSGQDRLRAPEERVSWDDVVLPAATMERLQEILTVFQRPELGRMLSVKPPAGILLYGPPGCGKTTIAKALASEVRASFYEQSAADLLSKYVGESEERVSRLFRRANEMRPSIIFIDEVDALLKRRTAGSAAPWEERMVSQFLRELDGLEGLDGVLLVGATNRVDMIDEAARQRRLVPIEVPLPDPHGRRRLLESLCRGMRLAKDVNLGEVADLAEGMSGADLKAVRNSAGMKALTRVARDSRTEPQVMMADFAAALRERGLLVIPD